MTGTQRSTITSWPSACSDTCLLLGFAFTSGGQRFWQKSQILAKQGQPNRKPSTASPFVGRCNPAPTRDVGGLTGKQVPVLRNHEVEPFYWTLGLVLKSQHPADVTSF